MSETLNRWVWENGAWYLADELRVSPFDLGGSVGMGVFETLAAYDGKVFGWRYHRERMSVGVDVLSLNPSLLVGDAEFEHITSELLERNHLTSGRARVRVALSAGEVPLAGGDPTAICSTGRLLITAVALGQQKEQVSLGLIPFPSTKKGPLIGVKSNSFAEHVMAWRWANRHGYDEGICVTEDGEVSECCMSNLFYVTSDGVVVTPRLKSGCLPGVTRRLVLELCRSNGLPIEEKRVKVMDVESAREVFITSSLREVQRAYFSDSQRGDDSPLTRKIQTLYKELLVKEMG